MAYGKRKTLEVQTLTDFKTYRQGIENNRGSSLPLRQDACTDNRKSRHWDAGRCSRILHYYCVYFMQSIDFCIPTSQDCSRMCDILQLLFIQHVFNNNISRYHSQMKFGDADIFSYPLKINQMRIKSFFFKLIHLMSRYLMSPSSYN